MMVCTEPLPNVGAPTSVARCWSRKAPATSSAALALNSLTRTAAGPRRSAPAASARTSSTTCPRRRVGDGARLVDEPARVVAQVEHDAREVAAGLASQASDVIDELGMRAALERLHALVGDLAVEELTRDAGHHDDAPHQREEEQAV